MKDQRPRSRRTRKLTLAGEWYDAQRARHERFGRKMRDTIEEMLIANGIQFEHVSFRVKTRDSYLRKAGKRVGRLPKYRFPTREIKDTVGLRVVTYLESTLAKVAALIESEFRSTEPIASTRASPLARTGWATGLSTTSHS